jgi:hypothetical protein
MQERSARGLAQADLKSGHYTNPATTTESEDVPAEGFLAAPACRQARDDGFGFGKQDAEEKPHA